MSRIDFSKGLKYDFELQYKIENATGTIYLKKGSVISLLKHLEWLKPSFEDSQIEYQYIDFGVITLVLYEDEFKNLLEQIKEVLEE